MLFFYNKARNYTQLDITFPYKRVKITDKDNWVKFKQLFKNIHRTIYLILFLQADNLKLLKCYVYVSYMTHNNCKGYKVEMLTIVIGYMVSK